MINLKRLVAFLLCVIMLLSFCSCEYIDRLLGTEQESPADDSQEQGKEEEGKKENVTDSTPEDDEGNKEDDIDETEIFDIKENAVKDYGIELDENGDLIIAILDYMRSFRTDYSMISWSIPAIIDRIIKGIQQPLRVTFDPSSYYYVGVYCNDDHVHYGDRNYFCCEEEYTWVKFDSACSIREYYGDEKLVAAFQINRASNVVDMMERNEVPYVEHFFVYDVEFEDGYNTKAPVYYNETHVYLNFIDANDTGDSILCYTTLHKLSQVFLLPTAMIDGELYFLLQVGATHYDGVTYIDYLYSEDHMDYAGEHYDTFISLMKDERHCVEITNSYGTFTVHYGIIAIDDFMNVVKSCE